MIQETPFARKISARLSLGGKDLSTISEIHLRRRKFAPGTLLILQGDERPSGFILAAGWAFVYKTSPDGQRQIVNFKLPGDFLGVRGVLFKSADLSAEALTPIEASELTQEQVFNVFTKTPLLATAVLWAVTRDDAMVVEHLVGLGQRRAAQRLVHLLLELDARLKLVGLADDAGFACPLTQYHLADALGLSAVHVNRALREVRLAGLMTFREGRVTFQNYKGSVKFANFDPAYLDHDHMRDPAWGWSADHTPTRIRHG